jgi:Tfp pilus assembly protein PilO
MTGRDRLVARGHALRVVLAGGWMLVVSPERKRADEVSAEVGAARQKLEAARSQLSNARTAQAQYSTAYAALVRLGKAVPPEQQVPALVYELNQASNDRNVEFASITATQSGSGSLATSKAAAALQASVFTPMPFTFVFKGSYYQLFHLFRQLESFTQRTPNGEIQVSGRLLTIQNVTLTHSEGGSSGEPSSGKGSSSSKAEQLTGTITATAYVLPVSQGLTGGATATGPTGTPVSTSGSGSPSAPAAVVTKVGP